MVQPLLDQLSRNLPFLIHHRLDPYDLFLFLALFALGMPLLLFLVARTLERFVAPKSRTALVFALVAILAAAWSLRLARLTGLDTVVLSFGAAALSGLAVAWAAARHRSARIFLSICALGLPVFVLLFLSNPSVLGFLVEHFVPTYPQVEERSDIPVVMVIFDEFPLLSLLDQDQKIDERLYPNFAKLSMEATWYRNATTIFWRTEESVTTLLTGHVARLNAAPILSNYPRNLFTLLAGSHDIQAVEQVTQLLPAELRPSVPLGDRVFRQRSTWTDLAVLYAHMVMPESVAAHLPRLENWGHFLRLESTLDEPSSGNDIVVTSDEFDRNAELERFLARIGNRGERPPLHFLHVFLPHAPFRYLPSGRQYGGRTALGNRTFQEAWDHDRYFVEHTYLRHLLQVRYVDAFVGRLMDRMKELGLWDDSLVVLVADHGVSHWPGRPRRNPEAAGQTADAPEVDDILRMPLFIKAPHQASGGLDDRNVQTLDVFPTIVDLLDLHPGWGFEGRSAQGPPRLQRILVTRSGAIRSLEPEFQLSQASLERKLRLFGKVSGEAGVDGMFRFGPHSQLIGHSASVLPDGSKLALEQVALDQRIQLEHYDPDSVYAPTELTGRIRLAAPMPQKEGGTCRPIALAVVLNGTVRAMSEVQLDHGCSTGLFSALVPESSLRAGRNEAELVPLALEN